METTTTYRSENESLRAEVARLNKQLADMSEVKPKTTYRWQIERDRSRPTDWSDNASLTFFIVAIGWVGYLVAFACLGFSPLVGRLICSPIFISLCWLKTFCVRVKEK
jgi:hypothetical protein